MIWCERRRPEGRKHLWKKSWALERGNRPGVVHPRSMFYVLCDNCDDDLSVISKWNYIKTRNHLLVDVTWPVSGFIADSRCGCLMDVRRKQCWDSIKHSSAENPSLSPCHCEQSHYCHLLCRHRGHENYTDQLTYRHTSTPGRTHTHTHTAAAHLWGTVITPLLDQRVLNQPRVVFSSL